MTLPRHAPARRAAALLTALFIIAAPAAAQDTSYKPADKSPSSKQPAKKPADKKQDLKKEGEALFGDPGSKPASKPASGGHWSIVLEAYRGNDQDGGARMALERIKTEGGLKDAYLEQRGPALVIAYGKYPTEESARKDLERLRVTELVIDGVKARPFANAFLVPPSNIQGTIPEYDLRNARKARPDAMYTLQIAYYSREEKAATAKEMAEFRKAAEQAAVELRREGEEAYYFHGPQRSMVTVGIFTNEDFDSQTQYMSPALVQLRKKFPHNLYNGMGVKEKLTVSDPKTGKAVRKDRLRPSGLVLVPKES
jgi:hypothetical protein